MIKSLLSAPFAMRIYLIVVLCLVSCFGRAADVTNRTNETIWTTICTNADGKTIATFTVISTEVPELRPWAEHAGQLCVVWYPKIASLLASDGFTPPQTVRLILRKDMQGVASTSRDHINIAAQYVQRHPDDFGMVIHELTHVVQSYPPRSKPGWLTEGIADYIRVVHFEPDARRPSIDPAKASYRDSYKTTAIFLEWIEKNQDRELIKALNRAMREGTFAVEIFKERTGKTVDELWKQFADSLKSQRPTSAVAK